MSMSALVYKGWTKVVRLIFLQCSAVNFTSVNRKGKVRATLGSKYPGLFYETVGTNTLGPKPPKLDILGSQRGQVFSGAVTGWCFIAVILR